MTLTPGRLARGNRPITGGTDLKPCRGAEGRDQNAFISLGALPLYLLPFVNRLRRSLIFASDAAVPSWNDPNHLSQGSSSEP